MFSLSVSKHNLCSQLQCNLKRHFCTLFFKTPIVENNKNIYLLYEAAAKITINYVKHKKRSVRNSMFFRLTTFFINLMKVRKTRNQKLCCCLLGFNPFFNTSPLNMTKKQHSCPTKRDFPVTPVPGPHATSVSSTALTVL